MIKKILLFTSLVALSGLTWLFASGDKQHQAVQIRNAPDTNRSTWHANEIPNVSQQTISEHKSEEKAATRANSQPLMPQQPEPVSAAEEVNLWVTSEKPSVTQTDGLLVHPIQVNPQDLRQFTVGQTLLLEVPGQASQMKSQLTETHNDPGGIKVWQGRLTDEPEHTNVMITQGKIQTHITIASSRGNYSIVVNNQTGDGTIMDESQINERLAPIDDGIVFEGTSPLH